MGDDARMRERVRRVAAELAGRRADDRSIRIELLERAVDTVDRISHTINDQKLRKAVEEGTDTAFLAALSRLAVSVPAISTPTDPLAVARKRGEQAKRDILAAQGEMLDANEVAARLSCSVKDVDDRRQRGMLVALPLDTGAWKFPAWQFSDSGLLPGLEDVLRSLPEPGPWSRIQFLQSGDPHLNGQTPLDLIRRGDVETVRRLAAAYDELVAT